MILGADQPEVEDQWIWSIWSVVRDWVGIRGSLGWMNGFGVDVCVIVSFETSMLGRVGDDGEVCWRVPGEVFERIAVVAASVSLLVDWVVGVETPELGE